MVPMYISQNAFQLQIEHCEIDMNTLHSYGEGRRETERETEKATEINRKDSGERDKQERFCQHKPKLSMNWAQFRKV